MSYNEDPENREQLKRSEVKEKERGGIDWHSDEHSCSAKSIGS